MTIDIANDARPAVDEPGVDLHHRRTGADHLPRVFATHDAADADDRDGATRLSEQLLNDFAAALR